LPILCERHTTSKITSFDDLTSIATYGFRGEALASISHIAHLSVTTKTKNSDCAWRAHYLDGRLVPAKPGQSPDPKAVAGRPGTQITVEDLFFNVPTRRRAFRSPSDEYGKILDMVSKYSIHCNGVAFSCKKHGDSSTSVSIQASANVVDRIRQIYGGAVAAELVELSTSEPRWGFQASGWATNANFHLKKTTFLLFINHRCVESTNVKKAIEQLYSTFLPKNGHPFIYLSLEISPERVDVNVHPTKREVHFLNEDDIIQSVCEHIRTKLAAVDTSRTFMTQTLLPTGQWQSMTVQSEDDGTPGKQTPQPKRLRRNSNNLVRTDTSMRKITSMFSAAGGEETLENNGDGDDVPEEAEFQVVDREHTVCRLQSIKELRAEVREDMHNELTEMISSHTFVGIVDERRRLAAIQGGVKLFLIDYGRFCHEYCYQVGLTDFGNFGTIKFTPPQAIRELLRMAANVEKLSIESPEDDFDVDALVDKIASQLIERREMLSEYFSFEITPTGELVTLPMLIKGYTPALAKLPRFLLRLGPEVDWTDEKACFQSFLKELAEFYVPEQLPSTPGSEEEAANDETVGEEIKIRRRHVAWAVEHLFFPAFKARLVATKSLMEQKAVVEITDLKKLYRVFERC
jgi:DNA mismatch repair protein MLH1